MAAVDNRLCIINYNKAYIDNPDPMNQNELQKDPNIDIKIKNERFQRVFIGNVNQTIFAIYE
jgi:hypothetical protein